MEKVKKCGSCKEVKPLSNFHKNKSQYDGLNGKCKECRKEYDAEWCLVNREKVLAWKRQANKNMTLESRRNKNALNRLRAGRLKTATPPWADRQEIRYIYNLATERGLVVDHIVPLKHKLVCGLHVPDNLRCIPASMNATKSNKFDQEFASQHAAVAASFGIRALSKWGNK
jgi:hypothetical protein